MSVRDSDFQQLSPLRTLISRSMALSSRKGALLNAILVIYFILLFFPSANYHLFSGLPLNGLAELPLLLLIIPVLVSKDLRSHYKLCLTKAGQWCDRLLLFGGLLAIGAKVVLISTNTYEGFLACYRPLVNPLIGGECERSYENPLYRFGVTRIDSEIDFLERDWNLSFFNSLRFNFTPEIEGNIVRDRIPFKVNWRGTIQNHQPRTARITYVGEGVVAIGQRAERLPANYVAPARVLFEVSQGHQTIDISYRFDDGYRVGSNVDPGQHAIFKLAWVSEAISSHDASTISAIKAPLWGRALGIIVDVSLGAFLLSLLTAYLIVLKPYWLWLGIIMLAGIGAYISTDLPAFSSSRIFVILLWFLLAFLIMEARERERERSRLLFIYFALFYLAVMRTLLDFDHLNVVIYRPGGQDWLTYEGLARTILETGSLQGGEPVFYYQPFFRYLKFTEHILFGDSDALIACFILGSLNFSIFFMFMRFQCARVQPFWKASVLAFPIHLILLTVNAEPIVNLLQAGASEYPTWIFLPLIFSMLYGASSPGEWLIGTLLLGSSLIVRVNQLPALVVVFLIFFFSVYQYKPKWALTCTIIMIAISLLPLVHNLFYGGKGILFTSSTGTSANLVLPPRKLSTVTSDPDMQALFLRQLRAIFYIRVDEPMVPALAIAFHGLQLVWGAAVVWILVSWRKTIMSHKVLLFVPLLYLGVHLVYQVTVYYPRHIIAGYLAMGLATYFVANTVNWASLSGRSLNK